MTTEELVYIAAFMECEGCASVNTRSRRPRGKIQLVQNDEAIIRWMHAKLGMGTVHPMRKNDPTTWFLVINRQADVVKFVRMIWPHTRMKSRRARLKKAYQAALR
jgi:hypothetical protein